MCRRLYLKIKDYKIYTSWNLNMTCPVNSGPGCARYDELVKWRFKVRIYKHYCLWIASELGAPPKMQQYLGTDWVYWHSFERESIRRVLYDCDEFSAIWLWWITLEGLRGHSLLLISSARSHPPALSAGCSSRRLLFQPPAFPAGCGHILLRYQASAHSIVELSQLCLTPVG